MTLIRRHSLPVFFDDFLTKEVNQTTKKYTPASNIQETEKEFILDVILPTVQKEEIQLEVQEDLLVIFGEKSIDETEYAQQEFQIKEFERKFILPKNVQRNLISAKHENGVLQVIIPKLAEQDTKTTITIS